MCATGPRLSPTPNVLSRGDGVRLVIAAHPKVADAEDVPSLEEIREFHSDR